MTGTPGGITPGAMSQAAAATPYGGGLTPGGGGGKNFYLEITSTFKKVLSNIICKKYFLRKIEKKKCDILIKSIFDLYERENNFYENFNFSEVMLYLED